MQKIAEYLREKIVVKKRIKKHAIDIESIVRKSCCLSKSLKEGIIKEMKWSLIGNDKVTKEITLT